MKTDHFKGESLLHKVGRIPKGDGQIDLPTGLGLLPRYDAVEGHPGRQDACPTDPYGIERLNVHDVEATAPIHQHLAKVLWADEWIDDKQIPA
jgi:hypothetical protein